MKTNIFSFTTTIWRQFFFLLLASLFMFMVCFNFGFATVPFAILGELYSTPPFYIFLGIPEFVYFYSFIY